ncbi:uncharacterized protein LOC132792010 [Drosophila nasuta]|uniref:uncharacterized protein LOC132792010 n=1 Tax=Drosophila nasuta TaxID=42062 RepID=UPI00295ECE0E|nr:uncharacterized protein LOC132792010 [Drosophila nasuta]
MEMIMLSAIQAKTSTVFKPHGSSNSHDNCWRQIGNDSSKRLPLPSFKRRHLTSTARATAKATMTTVNNNSNPLSNALHVTNDNLRFELLLPIYDPSRSCLPPC